MQREADGNQVLVVVSAMAGETDRLVQLCREAAPLHDPTEYDVVVASGEQLDLEGVRTFARERLAAYKYPRHVIRVDSLPKGPTGKIDKKEIDRARLGASLHLGGPLPATSVER